MLIISYLCPILYGNNRFKHRQSAHCENGVASNLLYFNGVQLSEPMVFGIGSGLLFFYFPWIKVNEAPAISYRTMPGHIFSKVAKRLGFKVKRQKFSSPEKAQQALDDNLAKGIPSGLQVGVFNLPYFPDEYRFHFNAHNLVVYGKEDGKYLISDPRDSTRYYAYPRRTHQSALPQWGVSS